MAFDGDIAEYQKNLQDHQDSRIQGAVAKVQELFASKGETFGDDEAKQMSEEPPRIPPFPIFIFAGAFIKDALDVALDLTIVGIIAACFFTIVFSIILAFWCFGKISGGFWKRAIIKHILVRYGICMTLEALPGIQIIPTTMIFVLLAHFHETKIAKLFNEGLEYLHGAGWKG